MKLASSIAFRIYDLKTQTRAIAFNTQTRQFMFLEGLSVELLQLLVGEQYSELKQWMLKNELAETDVRAFSDKLVNFGFYNSSSTPPQNRDIGKEISNNLDTEHRRDLDLFLKVLHEHGLYYYFHIDLTNRCNERCIHCYHPFECYDYSNELSTEEVKSLIDKVYDLGAFVVTLSGGECLLRDDFFEILEYISDKNILSVIFTNGILLTEDIVQHLSKYRVKTVSISIYGDEPEIHDKITTVKGSFAKTMSGVALLKKYNIPFEIKSVLMAENIERTEQIRALSRKLNYGRDCRLDFSLCGKINGDCDPLIHQASLEAIKKVFYANPERYIDIGHLKTLNADDFPCGAGKYRLYCSADGEIYPCVSFRLHICHYSELPQIRESPILRQWLQTKIRDFTDCMKHEYCKYCSEICAGNNLIENGNYLNSKNGSRCELAKIITEWVQKHREL